MKPKIPTVTIKRDGNPVRINASSYDKEKHGAIVSADPGAENHIEDLKASKIKEPEPTPPTKPEGEGSPTPAPDTDAQAAQGQVTPHPAEPLDTGAPSQPDMGQSRPASVMKKGRKWFVTDAQGVAVEAENIDASGYKTEKEAWDAIMNAG